MLSELTQAMIVNSTVLVAVLHSDLGTKKIGPFRIVRPMLIAAAIIPLFIDRPATSGTGLTIEVAAILAGLLGGLVALAFITVHRSPQTGQAVSKSGTPYALLWILVIGARAAFSYGSSHWFHNQLGHWMITHHATAAAITDGLIFMAVAMLLTRTIGIATRAARLPEAEQSITAGANAF